MLSLSQYLHESHIAVVSFGSLLTIAVALSRRKLNKVMLPMYIMFIVYMTVMFREIGVGMLNLELFWSYRLFKVSSELKMEILNNIWLFIPLGAGLCELDDVISNGIGGLIGVAVCMHLREWIDFLSEFQTT